MLVNKEEATPDWSIYNADMLVLANCLYCAVLAHSTACEQCDIRIEQLNGGRFRASADSRDGHLLTSQNLSNEYTSSIFTLLLSPPKASIFS